MNNQEFVYTTYIKTTPEKLWAAITTPEFSRQYWGGGENISSWKKGAKWEHFIGEPEKTLRVIGEVIESVPPKRLVLTWGDPNDRTDISRVSFDIEQIEDMVSLRVIHGDFKTGSNMAERVSSGWPRVLSSLKSFLETGKSLNVWAGRKGDCGSHSTSAQA